MHWVLILFKDLRRRQQIIFLWFCRTFTYILEISFLFISWFWTGPQYCDYLSHVWENSNKNVLFQTLWTRLLYCDYLTHVWENLIENLWCIISDVDVEKPDEKSVMTYVAQFLKAYPEAGEDPSVSTINLETSVIVYAKKIKIKKRIECLFKKL